ncbi:putative bifunctional diguanylate cyclase/phosphodiesterase [Mycolicibacterium sp. CBM1]
MARVLRSCAMLCAFSLAYALAMLVGRDTRLAGGEVALVWPSAAVAIIWLLTIRRSGPWERTANTVMLGAMTFAMNIVTGAPLLLGAWFAIVNVTLAVVTVAVLTHRHDDVALRDPADLTRLIGAVAAGVLVAAALATALLVPVEKADAWETFALLAVRNGASALLGVSLWLRIRDVDWRPARPSAAEVVKAVIVGAGVVFVFAWMFWLNSSLPLAFLILVLAMWLALRYSTTVNTLFLAVAGSWIVFATMSNRGVLIVPDIQVRALLAQALVCSLTLVVLTLSLYRDFRVRLISELEMARDQADRNSELLGAVLDSIHDGVLVVDPTGEVILQNARATDSGLASYVASVARGESADKRTVSPGGAPREVVITADNSRVIELATTPLVRRSLFSVTAFRDITEEKAAEEALAESEERFRLAFDTAPMGMFMYEMTPHRSGYITRCNQAMADVLGRPAEELLGMRVTDLGKHESDTRTATLDCLLTLEAGQPWEAETAFRRADGATVWGAVSACAVAPAGSSPYGICLVEDITGRKRAEADLQYLALHDLLTGLANRALFMDRIEHALAAAERESSVSVGLIFLDLDGFKAVNDTWGHAQGDETLKVVAGRIQASVRPGDTAARLGGDEFAVLCPAVSDLDQLRTVAERIQAELRRPVRLTVGGIYDELSVSAGAVIAQAGSTADTLLQRADRLMYHAKRSGKDRVLVGEPSQEAVVLRAARMRRELDRAVERSEFVLHFQTIVDLRTADVVAAEALLRWEHPQWGLLTPDEFLPLAETSPQMPEIGRYVLSAACRSAAQWTGPMASSAVHVNVSGRQLEAGRFHAAVLEALDKTGLSPDRLVLELTETHVEGAVHSAKADLERLRQIGVRIAIDDVGTGFSDLAKILELQVDILKIDKQFIGGLPADLRCAAITKAVLSLGASLGLAVIAEGVESQEQCDLLAEWGCELGQGFLFEHAVTAEATTGPARLAGSYLAT